MTDFFEREFQGCELNHNTPAEGCIRIHLSTDAQASLSEFIQDDRSLSARRLRRSVFSITFNREVHQRLPADQQRSVHFMNHLSPLIRWITQINKERAHTFFDVSALTMTHPSLPPGDYCYRVERWKLAGLSNREILSYGVGPLSSDLIYSEDHSELIFQYFLRQANDWVRVDCDKKALLNKHSALESELNRRFDSAVTDFVAENETSYQIKEQRVRSIFDRRIEQDKQRLRTLREANRAPRIIRMAEGRLKAGTNNKEKRLHELAEKAEVDMEQAQVAAGVFRVTRQ